MKLGEIYAWETDKAEGYENRRKYHLFICPTALDDDNTFLFINSVEWYKDFKILKAKYAFLAYDSFIGCNAIVTYSDGELKTANPQLSGQLSVDDLKALRDAIIAAETMERRDMNRVCAVLATIL